MECEREVWEDEKMKTIERDRGEMKKNHADPIYRKVIKLDRSRCVERCQEVSSFKMHELFIKELSRICQEVSIAKGSR